MLHPTDDFRLAQLLAAIYGEAVLFDPQVRLPDELVGIVDLDDPDADLVPGSIGHLVEAGLDPRDPLILELAVVGARKRGDDIRAELGSESFRRHQEAARLAAERAEQRRVHVRPTQATLYYARIGNRVKIGFTLDLKQRMQSLNPEELLATEPGSLRKEAERHRQFADLRTHGEWFRYERPLTDHVESLRS